MHNLRLKKTDYVLADGQNELRIPLTLEKNGITYTKTLIVKRDSYAIDVEYTVNNPIFSTSDSRNVRKLKAKLIG